MRTQWYKCRVGQGIGKLRLTFKTRLLFRGKEEISAKMNIEWQKSLSV